MVAFSDSAEIFEKLYPGYVYADCMAKGNEINGGKYIYLSLCKKEVLTYGRE